MKIQRSVLLLAFLLTLASPAFAQTPQPPLQLSLRRNFGYGGGSRIQGLFTASVSDDPQLTQVTFMIDDQVMTVGNQPPFSHRFSTSEYPPGVHTLSAVGLTQDGQQRLSNQITKEFITAEEARGAAVAIIIPLLGVVAIAALVTVLLPALVGRRQVFRPGEYGSAGGAICPRCGLPYSRHFLAPNLVTGKLERCPHCGKWAIMARASPEALIQAEARLAEESGQGAPEVDRSEASLRRALDESRFDE